MKQRVSFNQKIFWAMVLVMWPPSIFTHVKTLSISICVNIIFVNIISTVSLCVTDLVPKSLSLSPQPNVSTIFLGGRYWHSSGAGQIGLTQIEKQKQKDKVTLKNLFLFLIQMWNWADMEKQQMRDKCAILLFFSCTDLWGSKLSKIIGLVMIICLALACRNLFAFHSEFVQITLWEHSLHCIGGVNPRPKTCYCFSAALAALNLPLVVT